MRLNCLIWAVSQWRRVWFEDWSFFVRRTRQEIAPGKRGWWVHVGITPSLPADCESFVPTDEAQAALLRRPWWRRLVPPLLFKGHVKRGDA